MGGTQEHEEKPFSTPQMFMASTAQSPSPIPKAPRAIEEMLTSKMKLSELELVWRCEPRR